MREARDLFVQSRPTWNATASCRATRRCRRRCGSDSLMDTTLTGEANLLVCPTLDAANILFNVLKMTGGHGVTVGPILLGAKAPVHVLTPSATVRRIVNMTALVAAAAMLQLWLMCCTFTPSLRRWIQSPAAHVPRVPHPDPCRSSAWSRAPLGG